MKEVLADGEGDVQEVPTERDECSSSLAAGAEYRRRKGTQVQPAPARQERKGREGRLRQGASRKRSSFFDDGEGGRATAKARSASIYRKLDKTMEWAENNYYKLPIAAAE